MPIPATLGQLRTNMADMQIGDYIICKYTASSGAVGTFSELGTSTDTEIPITGTATPNGTFYFIKVAKGLLVADRVVQVSISWGTLNAGKFIEGKTMTLGTTSGILRSLTGGVAYADENGNMTLTYTGLGGFPTNNEYDKYIRTFPTNLIQAGKTIDDVFHCYNMWTFTQDTPVIGTWDNGSGVKANETSSFRLSRGNETGAINATWKDFFGHATNTTSTSFGFRPVFEYIES